MEPAIFISDEDVEVITDWKQSIEALRNAYTHVQLEGSTPERAVAATRNGWLRVMPSAPTGGKYAGSKTISAAIKNGKVSYLISLFDQDTSSLVALIDGNRITGIRTAATAAVAVNALMTKEEINVAVIGSGFEAQAQLRALSTIRQISSLRVYSPTSTNRERFADLFKQELSIEAQACDSVEEAAKDADLIICAARAQGEIPVLKLSDVRRDALIVSVGSTTTKQRELNTDLIKGAGIIVADALEEVLFDSGDIVAAREEGFEAETITVSLEHLLCNKPEVDMAQGPVIYKSTGSGFQDLVLAGLLYETALAQGRGTTLGFGILTIQK